MLRSDSNLNKIKEDLKTNLSSKRFAHTESVVETALKYASALDLKANECSKLEVAAWLHDACKELKGEELLNLAKHYGIKIYPEDEISPNVLHARVGAAFIEDKYEIYDPEILAAIREHTLGSAHMSEISKILYLADFSEPYRDKKDKEKNPKIDTYCDVVRNLILEKHNLDAALLEAMDSKISHVIQKKQAIHPIAIEARNALL